MPSSTRPTRASAWPDAQRLPDRAEFYGQHRLFVGAFLIYNAFSMTVVERTREFGLLRCIGLTREQVIIQVLFEGLVLGLFGSVAGGLLGFFCRAGWCRSCRKFSASR
jgi:predicted lysophospholipase L1 biosynthesis ABC-type transport system permease subunit